MNPDALLNSLYRLYLGRPADEGGKAYWKDRIINEKLTMEALNDGFAYSQEFAGIVAGFGNRFPVLRGLGGFNCAVRVIPSIRYFPKP